MGGWTDAQTNAGNDNSRNPKLAGLKLSDAQWYSTVFVLTKEDNFVSTLVKKCPLDLESSQKTLIRLLKDY